MKNNNAQPRVYISQNGGRKKIYKETLVYLKDKEEFDLELTNPTTDTLLAKIELNGDLISSSGLVIKPGEKYVLKRYIDENKKFIFNTYDIDGEDSDMVNAVVKNGHIKVIFYKEEKTIKINCNPCIWINNENHSYYGNNLRFNTNTGDFKNNETTLTSNYYSTSFIDMSQQTFGDSFPSNSVINSTNISKKLGIDPIEEISNKLETGRVEKGGISDQEFEHVQMNFEAFSSYTTVLTIFPESKHIEDKETLNIVFCSKCGKKCKSKDDFCSKCGTKLYK